MTSLFINKVGRWYLSIYHLHANLSRQSRKPLKAKARPLGRIEMPIVARLLEMRKRILNDLPVA